MIKKHIIYSGDVALSNKIENGVSSWIIANNDNRVVININRVNSYDVVALITINCSKNKGAVVMIKQTPTRLYISYDEKSIGYDLNKCNRDIIISIIEDYMNKNGFGNNAHIKEAFKIMGNDIDNIFEYIYNNKDKYINCLNKELNNVRAEYVMRTEVVKRKIKVMNNYQINPIDK